MNIYNFAPRTWTEVEDAFLAKLWGEGFSASEISRQMPGRTRNAIIGRTDRLNLPHRKTRTAASRAKSERKPRVYVPRKPRLRLVIDNAPKIAKENLWHPLDNAEPITILDRTRHQCAWPVDRPHEIGKPFVCGQPVVQGHSYCGSHCRVAYEPRKRA